MNILKEIKNSPFIYPKKKYYLGVLKYGTPYFYPREFHSSILSITKDKPKYIRKKNFNLFGFNISYGWPVWFHRNDLGWKDKFNSPRHEWNPSFSIYFFKWQFHISWMSPLNDQYDDRYWEMILWYLYYSDKDIKKAEEDWGWLDCRTETSTWNKNYIK